MMIYIQALKAKGVWYEPFDIKSLMMSAVMQALLPTSKEAITQMPIVREYVLEQKEVRAVQLNGVNYEKRYSKTGRVVRPHDEI